MRLEMSTNAGAPRYAFRFCVHNDVFLRYLGLQVALLVDSVSSDPVCNHVGTYTIGMRYSRATSSKRLGFSLYLVWM